MAGVDGGRGDPLGSVVGGGRPAGAEGPGAGAGGGACKSHAQHLAAAEQAAAARTAAIGKRLPQAHGQNVQALAAIQAGLGRQAEVLERAIHASGEIARLEDALNRNLAALAGAKNFEQTVLGLAAAIHLLNARLTEAPAAGRAARPRRGPQAA